MFRLLNVAGRAALESHLRSALADDPGLSSLVDDLRAGPTNPSR